MTWGEKLEQVGGRQGWLDLKEAANLGSLNCNSTFYGNW